jgi:murein DD-endopeptidase MepM/ murein hydrolase activator NlpD
MAAAIAIPLLGMVAAFGIAPNTSTEAVTLRNVEFTLPVVAPPAQAQTEEAYAYHDRVRKDDTVSSLLARLNADDAQALSFLREDRVAKAVFHELLPGRTMETRVTAAGALLGLRLRTGTDKVIKIVRTANGFESYLEPVQLDRRTVFKTGVIRSSLFAATDAAGVPDSVANQLTKLFATKVDFHDDLRRGDRFSVLFEALFDGADFVKTGRVLAAEFVNQGETHRLVYFEESPDRGAYYTPGGRSMKSAFLRSPLEFSRVSSGFSAGRFHPIFSQWRAHKGVDFVSPAGTPVVATSDGKVDFVGRQGGYGNVIELKHHEQYTTLYAHLSRFASGLSAGTEVRQGDVIGFVGASGWASGPHLHYEFRIAGVHQDPLGSAVPTSSPLSGSAQAAFEAATQPLVAQLDAMRQMASVETYE